MTYPNLRTMKPLKFLIFLLVGLAFFLPTTSGFALVFFDDFSDGNTDGWVFPYNSTRTQFPGGVWSVEDETLVQHTRTDANVGLVDNLFISDQVIEVQTRTDGYAGVVFWYQQVNNDYADFVAVNLSTGTGSIDVDEFIDGIHYVSRYNHFVDSRLYELTVDVDSGSGDLGVYLDSAFIFTYTTNTSYRTGLSGVYSGNEHGYFDNFRVTSEDVFAVPEPSTFFFLSAGFLASLLNGNVRKDRTKAKFKTADIKSRGI